MKRFYVFLFLSFFCAISAMEQPDIQPDRITVLMPICISAPNNRAINLLVQIPDYFRSIQPIDLRPCREFIPKTDCDENNWSEIITTQTYPGMCMSAAEIIDAVQSGICSCASEVRVFENKKTSQAKYNSALLRMIYTTRERKELLYAYYFSGQCDCSGLQYSINLEQISAEEATLKIYRFLRNQVEVGNLPLYAALKKLATSE